jgi:hypothetical protein
VGLPPEQRIPVAHVCPFSQQPPPRLDAQENQPVWQVYADVDVGVGVGVVVDVVVGMVEAEGVVGTTMTAVEDVGGGGGADEGWTYVIDVPTRAPNVVSSDLSP